MALLGPTTDLSGITSKCPHLRTLPEPWQEVTVNPIAVSPPEDTNGVLERGDSKPHRVLAKGDSKPHGGLLKQAALFKWIQLDEYMPRGR
jgi:hypothetical protein